MEHVEFTAAGAEFAEGAQRLQLCNLKSERSKRKPLRFLRVLCACGGESDLL
jgi:hypothetical protein